MKKIIIEQCIAVDATPEAFELLAEAIVLDAPGYGKDKEYKLSKSSLELIIKQPLLAEEKKAVKEPESPIPVDDDPLLSK